MLVTPLIAALLLLHLTLLSCFVSYLRITLRISFGDGENRDMFRAIRAHANALEHALPFIVLLLLLEMRAGASEQLWWLSGGFVAARVLHSLGVLNRIHRVRQIGATVSVLLELVFAIWLLRACLGCC
ncbi:MAG: MAPEG family protein [Myxococcales bacterium]|nr:MAPEG family protein [Myxococcales bacterium]MCB9754862.1 MAPEG family protein [Myxococcales bacterium]